MDYYKIIYGSLYYDNVFMGNCSYFNYVANKYFVIVCEEDSKELFKILFPQDNNFELNISNPISEFKPFLFDGVNILQNNTSYKIFAEAKFLLAPQIEFITSIKNFISSNIFIFEVNNVKIVLNGPLMNLNSSNNTVLKENTDSNIPIKDFDYVKKLEYYLVTETLKNYENNNK